MNYTPSNIFDVQGKEIPMHGGGFCRAVIRPNGGGWNVTTVSPINPADKSDPGMLPLRTIAEDIDIWSACGILNEIAADSRPYHE